MTASSPLLPSWRPGATRDAVVAFLDAAEALPVEQRVAAFDNDGTLWCEKPTYVQFDFFEDALRTAAAADPALRRATGVRRHPGRRPGGHRRSSASSASPLALGELFVGERAGGVHRPGARVHGSAPGTAPSASRSARTVYQPMLELLEELRRRRVHDLHRHRRGHRVRPRRQRRAVRRRGRRPWSGRWSSTSSSDATTASRAASGRLGCTASANEGPAKVANIQTQLGRRPILGGGQLRRRPGDARVGLRRRACRAWRCSSTTTTRSVSSAT